MQDPVRLQDCLATWVDEYHPDWEVVDAHESGWGEGTYIHWKKGVFCNGSKKVRIPHIAVLEDSKVLNCCGPLSHGHIFYAVEPDFFEKLSSLITLNEEACNAQRK